MKIFYMKKAFLTLGFLLLIPVFVIAQTFTIEQSVTGNNRSDIRGQVFIPSEQDNGTGTITSAGPVYLTAFDVIYDAGAEAPTLYIYSSLPTDLTSLDDGTGGTLVGESTGKAAGTFPYTTYSFDFLELDKNTTYYALFRQDVQLEFGGSGAIEGPYTGGKMLVNTGTAVAENNYSALKFIGTFENTLPPHQGDVDALIALYDATGGANWTKKWDLYGNPYKWYGITWSGTRVTRINMHYNNLSGVIPAELGSLSSLYRVELSSNALNGTIPAELGNASKLSFLNLSYNSLSGAIPSELANLSNLIYLYLRGNSLSGDIPAELGNLTNLSSLELDGNSLTGTIPAELGSLPNLTILDLNKNSLTGSIPAELGNLPNLLGLYLNENSLTGTIPVELMNLSKLKWLDLGSNSLSGTIPAELENLTNLTRLYLNENVLAGTIPVELGSLTKLTRLNLSGNSLTGIIPAELGNLFNLTELYFSSNSLSGNIPAELANLSNLLVLYLDNNFLSGVSFDLNVMTKLKTLHLYNNNFDFGDFEALGGFFSGISDVKIHPQAGIAAPEAYVVAEFGTVIELVVQTEGTQNEYEWYKDGKTVSGVSTNPIFIVDNFQKEDIGFYYCKITSPSLPALTLYSKDIEVTVPLSFNENSPVVKKINLTNITVGININKVGTVYYMALPRGDDAPSAQQLFEGKNSMGEAVIESGSKAVPANVEIDIIISGIDATLLYDLYFIAADGIPTYSELVSLQPSTVTGLDEWTSRNGLRVYPVPSLDQVTIELSGIPEYQVVITDLNGQVHYSHHHEAGRAEIDIRHLAPGIYMLQLRSDDKSGWMKIIKE